METITKWDWQYIQNNHLWMEAKYVPGGDYRYAYHVTIFDEDGVQGSSSSKSLEDAACLAYNWWQTNRAVWIQQHKDVPSKLRAIMDKFGTNDTSDN